MGIYDYGIAGLICLALLSVAGYYLGKWFCDFLEMVTVKFGKAISNQHKER